MARQDLRANAVLWAALDLRDWSAARELREQLEERVQEETPAQLVMGVTRARRDRSVSRASVVSRVLLVPWDLPAPSEAPARREQPVRGEERVLRASSELQDPLV